MLNTYSYRSFFFSFCSLSAVSDEKIKTYDGAILSAVLCGNSSHDTGSLSAWDTGRKADGSWLHFRHSKDNLLILKPPRLPMGSGLFPVHLLPEALWGPRGWRAQITTYIKYRGLDPMQLRRNSLICLQVV